MALTKIGKEGITGISNSSDANAITIDSSERVGIGTSSPISDAKLTISSDNTESNIFLERSGSGRFDVAIANTSGALVFKGGSDQTTVAGLTEFMKIDGDTGAVTKPLQPAFQAHPSSTQTNLANGTTIAFGTERFDNNADFASNTFTAPVTGKYQINANVSLVDVDSSANFVGILVLSSNRAYYAYHGTGGFDSDVSFLEMSVNQLIDMDANDTVYVIFHQNGGTQQTDIHEDITNFSGYLVA